MTKITQARPTIHNDAIICDFDATVTTEDVCDLLMAEFGGERWRDVGEKYLRGELSHQELNKKFISFLEATPDQINKFISQNVSLRPGFNGFVEYCYTHDYALFIVSSGWNYYIKKILSQFESVELFSVEDLLRINKYQLFIICNKIQYQKSNNKWKIESPSFPNSLKSAPDKKFILTVLKNLHYNPVVVIGDSINDIEAASIADKVFARDSLADLCKHDDIRYKQFETFNDIIKGLDT